MSISKITVRIEQEHECGQKHEQVYTMCELPLPKLTLHENYPNYGLYRDRRLEMYGNYDTVELNGVEIKDNKLLCKRCGKDVLFPSPRLVTP